MYRPPFSLSLTVYTLAASILAGCGGGNNNHMGSVAFEPEMLQQKQACDLLAGQAIAGTTIISAATVATTSTAPEHCLVRGLVLPQLNFAVRLPANWNKKLFYQGGGGYNGTVPGANAAALKAGYAQVSSDSGHQAASLDASFAMNDAFARQMFGSLSIPTVLGPAIQLIQTQYGRAPIRKYMEGCSNGGREGLMNVQRYPNLFDGVIARAPVYNWVGTIGTEHRTAVARAAIGNSFTTEKLSLLAGSMRTACDALDGVADGIISKPSACTFKPASLRCAGGSDAGNACLSDGQIALVTAFTAPLSLGGGKYVNVGWPLGGNEDYPGMWSNWVSSPGSLHFSFSDTTTKNYLAKNSAIDSLTYDWDSNPATLDALAGYNDATNADIRPFTSKGGKLILWNGGSDPGTSVASTTDYYLKAVNTLGGRESADQSIKLYVAPGVGHCSGGPGADSVDLLSALDKWVTQSEAPTTLVASKLDSAGNTVLSRPLCAYPEYPKYNGQGEVNSASSFTCTTP